MRKKQTLTLKDIIDVLAETDVTTVPDLYSDGDACYGLADLDNKKIFLQDKMSIQQRKYVVIHELFHMSDYLRGHETDEEETEARGQKLYTKLYGTPYELE